MTSGERRFQRGGEAHETISHNNGLQHTLSARTTTASRPPQASSRLHHLPPRLPSSLLHFEPHKFQRRLGILHSRMTTVAILDKLCAVESALRDETQSECAEGRTLPRCSRVRLRRAWRQVPPLGCGNI